MNQIASHRILNLASYKFAAIPDLPEWRGRLLTLCKDSGIKGTILLSTEGINLFVAGEFASIHSLLAQLRCVPGLDDLQPKYSETDHQPFTRMLVRIKKEIIAFGVPGIDPAKRASPKIAPKALKQWLDEGRSLTLLDTRNDYEVKLGTFENALPIGVSHFREFPTAVQKLPAHLKDQPIVMFCTGGIRCEKAGAYMETQGFKHVLQLEGGILKYFEECGGAHYRGECFVFDQRVGLDPHLQETAATQCYACLAPLSEAEQGDARYVAGQSCPYCWKTPAERMAATLAARQVLIGRATTPMPGSVPQDNFRPINVSQRCDGLTLLQTFCFVTKHLPESYWQQEIAAGMVLNSEHQTVSAELIVRAGERYLHKFPHSIEPDVNSHIEVLYEDEALVVLNKPAPLPMHAGGRFYRNTLQHVLNEVYRPQKPSPAHRLDANTTGLVLVARTRHFAGKLQPQFAQGKVRKHYLVRVQGHPPGDEFSCSAPIGSESGALGTRQIAQEGPVARTEFTVLKRCANSTLLEARPLTGRTNQIRIHCAHLGFPVCGDPTYLGGGRLGLTQTLDTQSPPLCLHAWKIAFTHPATSQALEFEAPAPEWAAIEPFG
jgi:UPF0176 protein